MNDKIDTGGSAFPCLDSHGIGYEGMTMREYFAAKAMQVVMADGRNHSADEVAQYSYKMADAMLKARQA